MSSEFVHLFPLSVYRDTLELDEPYRQRLVELTLGMEHPQADSRPSQSAWLGDTQGHEFLFQHPEFTELFRQISEKIRTGQPGVEEEQLTRSQTAAVHFSKTNQTFRPAI